MNNMAPVTLWQIKNKNAGWSALNMGFELNASGLEESRVDRDFLS